MTDIIERLRIESRREPHEPIWRDAIDEIDGPSTELQASTYPQLVAHRARKVARIAAGLMGLVPDSDKEAWIDLECAFEDAERCGTKPAKELLEAGIKAMRARK